jgi:hypothetical protein
MDMAAIPRAQGFMVAAIAEYICGPAVQVITTPAGLLDRLPTRQATRLVLEIIEKPQNSLTYATGVWLATQKVIRRDFDPAERTELDMLVLKAWRRDPAQASVDLAELIAELRPPELQHGLRPSDSQRARQDLVAGGTGEDVRAGQVRVARPVGHREGEGRAALAAGSGPLVDGAGAPITS